MIKLRGQRMATTHSDRHGDRIPRDALEELCRQIPDPWLLNNQHDLAKPPIARAYNVRFESIEDGEWAIIADVDVLDEAAFAGMGGYSIAYMRDLLSVDPDRPPEVEIRFNPRLVSCDEIGELVSLSREGFQIDGRELIQKALEPYLVLLIKFAVGAFFTAFFGKAGADTWDALRQKIKELAARRKEDQAQDTAAHFEFLVEPYEDPITVIVDVPVSDFPLLEADLELVQSALDQVAQFAAETRVSKVALVFARDPARWVVSYYVRDSGEIVAGT